MVWDEIVDGFEYVISFEWLGDIWEFISGMFDNMGEFSVGGAVFGLLSFAVVYFLRGYMLDPFLQYMGRTEALFWTIATYVACVVLGYFIGKRMFEE